MRIRLASADAAPAVVPILDPDDKYGKASYRNLAETIGIEAGDGAAAEVIHRLVLSTLIGNADITSRTGRSSIPTGAGRSSRHAMKETVARFHEA